MECVQNGSDQSLGFCESTACGLVNSCNADQTCAKVNGVETCTNIPCDSDETCTFYNYCPPQVGDETRSCGPCATGECAAGYECNAATDG
jgi:hypothetical protein